VRALRWHGVRDVRVDEVPEPTAAPGEVVVAVFACGMCGSDLHEYLHGPVYIPRQRHPLTGVEPPVTLGHEFAGRVVALGAGVESLRPGDRVAVNPCLVCGECAWCRSGRRNHCARLATLGLSRDGAFAPLVAVPTYGCHPLPDAVTDEQAAVVEPLSVAVHACRRGRLTAGERVAVVGAGPVGLLVLQVARALGGEVTAVIEPRGDRRRLARELGAGTALDPGAGDPGRALADLTGGQRADLVFECVGNPAAFATALKAAGKGGRVVLVGLLPEAVPLNALQLLAHEKELIGSSAYVDEFPEAIDLLARGLVRVDRLVTARIPLERAVSDGLEALLKPDAAHVKILVVPAAGKGAA
jgi:(R,R)-butanediol dehydrogenase/meso-butanediol dehydrogenase/diacetyl reductase